MLPSLNYISDPLVTSFMIEATKTIQSLHNMNVEWNEQVPYNVAKE